MIKQRGILFYIPLIIVLITISYKSSSANNINDEHLFSSKSNKYLYEIDRIRFTGNKSFSQSELAGVVSSRTSRRNTIHKIVDFYYSEFKKIDNINRILPPGAMNTMRQVLARWSAEIQYFEEAKAESDLTTLLDFYTQNGFHDAQAHFEFKGDTIDRVNELVFHIEESDRYSIDKIKYLGLASIDKRTASLIHKNKLIRSKDFFSEELVISEVNTIKKYLLDNGYYYTKYKLPVVSLDTINKLDSLTIEFFPGKRQKISAFSFVDSTFGQKVVTNSIKDFQLQFEPGDWYSREEIETSRQNLQSLGTFELVSIDTNSSVDAITDTTLALRVLTKYRKQQEWGVAPYLNRMMDNTNNTGFELSYLNRNIGGIAQSLNIFLRGEWRNISAVENPVLKWQLGVTFSQPFLWKIGNSRVGLSSQLIHSESEINTITDLSLSTNSFILKFPTKLPAWTYFNSMSFDFLVQWQRPVNFLETKEKELEAADNDSDKVVIEQIFSNYENLYLANKNSSGVEPTAFIFSFSVAGDSRDDLFSPTKGYYTNISTDLWAGLGIAKYARIQYSYNQFWSINKYTVFGLKGRAGYIYWWDRENSYIPADKLFYAGGANSVRGWDSRSLRYLTSKLTSVIENAKYLDFAQNFVGNRAILEGSFEVRWRFGRPKWTSDKVADVINMGVMTGYIDWGNTFHWLAFKDDEYYSEMTAVDYLKGLGVSVGLGLGVQTPVGPFRIDFALPVYDPTPINDLSNLVLTRYKLRQYFQIHFGLGYAF